MIDGSPDSRPGPSIFRFFSVKVESSYFESMSLPSQASTDVSHLAPLEVKVVQPAESNWAAAPRCRGDMQVPERQRGQVARQALHPQAGHGVVRIHTQSQAAKRL